MLYCTVLYQVEGVLVLYCAVLYIVKDIIRYPCRINRSVINPTVCVWQTSNKTWWDNSDSTTRLEDRRYEMQRVICDLQRSVSQVSS